MYIYICNTYTHTRAHELTRHGLSGTSADPKPELLNAEHPTIASESFDSSSKCLPLNPKPKPKTLKPTLQDPM